MKVLKVFFVFALFFCMNICYAAGNKVFCNIMTDTENEVATISVLALENGEKMEESDVIVYIKNSVEKCINDGIENITLTVSDLLVNEENIAKLIEGIDVICVVGCEEYKPSMLTGETMIIYTVDAPATDDNIANDAAVNEELNEKSLAEAMNSMILMSFVLIAVALIVLLAVKKKMRK